MKKRTARVTGIYEIMKQHLQKKCFGVAIFLLMAADGFAANVVADGSGDWSELPWMTTARLRVDGPTLGDAVILGGDSTVEFGRGNQLVEVEAIVVGFDNDGTYSFYDNANGSLTVTGGLLRAEGENGIRLAFGTGATATLNVSGGALETTIGRLDIALGDESHAEVHLSAGELVIADTTIIAAVNKAGQRASGVLRVSGGEMKSSIILVGL